MFKRGQIFTFMFNFVDAQQESDCTVPPLLMSEYERDIKNLALRRMYQCQSSDTALVNIPTHWQDTIAEGLAAIYNSDYLERDTVFDVYSIHDINTNTIQASKTLLIEVDTSYSWTQAWQNLNTITDNSYLDSLVSSQGLYLHAFYTSINYASLRVDSFLNMNAIGDSFEQVPGIISVSQDSYIGGAGKIIYDKIGDDWYFDFVYEWGDCPSGCIYSRLWSFKVSRDCSVDYLGNNSFNLFVDENDIQKEQHHIVLVYSNLGNNIITVKTNDTMFGSNYSVIDQLGRQVLSGKLDNAITSLDLGLVKTGIYFFQVLYQGEKITKSIIIN